jgi:hypothetical protein
VLSRRALNRATLARQLLLERSSLSALDAVEHLVGLQAQVPLDPYTALWSRLDGFEPGSLARLLEERRVVRTVVMRATIHLVSADDCLLLRPLMQPVLDAELRRHREFAPALAGVDLAPVVAVARRLLAESPLTGPRSPRRPRRHGSGARSRASRPSTTSCSGTSRPSGPRRPRTSRPGRG